jgi:hypothetical protein
MRNEASSRALESGAEAPVLDRRAFLGTAGLAAGAALAGGLAWAWGLQPSTAGVAALVASTDAVAASADADDAWHVDDMWGHRPRYAHAIPHAPPAYDPIAWERIEPIDRQFVA